MAEETQQVKTELEIFKKMAFNDYQYYDRRYETVSMVFAGFGLYGCFEMLKWYLANGYKNTLWLAISVLLWILILFINLFTIGREKDIRQYYMALCIPKEILAQTDINNAYKESKKLENKVIRSRNIVFVLTIVSVCCMLASLGCYLFSYFNPPPL
jgi:hypothetical protein